MLTVLSYGAGQDSTAILLKLIHDQAFRAKYAPGELIVVMADTGNEHPATIRHTKFSRDLCARHGIEFHLIKGDKDLVSFWQKTSSIGSKAYPKTCTDHLKIRPIYKFLDSWYADRVEVKRKTPKAATYAYAQTNGKIRVLIGIAKGEETRVADPAKIADKWRRENYEYAYPLIDCGLDRAGCQTFIRELGYEVPYPSNCMLCPFMNDKELLWLYRNHPETYALWVNLEAAKLEKHKAKGDKNFGVWGKKTLPEKLEEVTNLYGALTDAELDEYKFSHGHCVKSKY